jgi:electron transport complex protein RnfA
MSVTFVDLFKIIISAAFIENILLARYIGLCPYIGMSTNISNSLGMGMAVAFVMVLSSIVTWSLWNYIFIPLKLEYLRIMVFILVIAVLVQLVEILLKKNLPNLYRAMGIEHSLQDYLKIPKNQHYKKPKHYEILTQILPWVKDIDR